MPRLYKAHYKWITFDPAQIEKNRLIVYRTRTNTKTGEVVYQRRCLCYCPKETTHE